ATPRGHRGGLPPDTRRRRRGIRGRWPVPRWRSHEWPIIMEPHHPIQPPRSRKGDRMGSRFFQAVVTTALFAGRCRAAEPAPLRPVLERLLAKPVLDRAETDGRLADGILKRIPAMDLPSDRAEWEARAGELRREVLGKVIFAGVPRAIIDGSPGVVE